MGTNQAVLWEEIWKRTPNSKHFYLADGSKQAVIWMNAVHYEDENGNLQDIDTKLNDEADLDSWDFPVTKHGTDEFKAARDRAKADKKAGKLDRDTYDFQTLRVPFASKLPRNWKRGYTIGHGTDKLTFKPVGASVSKGYIDDQNNNEITYQDAWNDVDVTLAISECGIKETLLIKTDKAPSTFTFGVDGPLADDLTAGTLKIQPAWLEDSAGIKRDVTQTLRHEANGVFLDLVADVTGLTFPVTIDPTVSIGETLAGYIEMYGGLGNIRSYNSNGIRFLTWLSYSGGTYYKAVGVARFQTSLPTGSVISSAQLSGTISNANDNTGGNGRVAGDYYDPGTTVDSSDYSETYTQSAFNEMAMSSFTAGQVGSITLKNPAANIPVSGYVGVRLNNNEPTGGSSFTFEFDTSNLQLKVTYNVPPNAPTVTSPNGGETWNAQQTVTWTAATDTDVIDAGFASISSGQYILQHVNSSYISEAERFISPSSPCKITQIKCHLANLAGGSNTKLELWSSDASGQPSAVLESKVVAIANGDITITPGFITQLSANTKYFIVFSRYSAETYDVAVMTSDIYSGGDYWYKYNAAWYETASNDLAIEIDFSVNSSLQYEIQLSTDNGANYHDIVSLTTAGATSGTYDFSGEPQSSTCLVRIRAYDGTSYGPWDTSNGVFTIQHNQAPTAPTNLAPDGGVSRDRASTIRLSWQHNDPNAPDPQSKFDLQYSSDGGTNWTTVTQVTTNQYYDVQANTFPHGNVLWKVRTYDQAGVSGPYSAQATFLAGDKPAAATITSPVGTVAVARPTVQWSSVGQTAYQVQTLDAGNTIVYDSGMINSTNKAHTIGTDLANGANYTNKVLIQNSDVLTSDPASASISVSYTPPPKPTLSVAQVKDYLELSWSTPPPSGTQPNVSYYQVFKREDTTKGFTLYQDNVTGTDFKDYQVGNGVTYQYAVQAVGDNGTNTMSDLVTGTAQFSNLYISDQDTGTSIQLVANLEYDNASLDRVRTDLQPLYGKYSTTVYGSRMARKGNVKATIVPADGQTPLAAYRMFEQLVNGEIKKILTLRKSNGEIYLVDIFNLTEKEERYSKYKNCVFEFEEKGALPWN